MGCGTIAALALGGAGAGAKIDAASSERDAMNQTTQQQINTQNAYAKKGMSVFDQSLAQSTPQAMSQQQQAGSQQVAQATKAAALTPVSLPSNTDQSNAANVSYQGQQAKNQLAQGANADLQGYSNIGLQQGLKDQSANSQLGVIGTDASRSASIFSTLLQNAQNSSSGEASIGSLLSTLGSVLGMASATGLLSKAATPASTLGSYSSDGASFANNAANGIGAQQAWTPIANSATGYGF
jgi:hypothetical protein